jgi:Co/Zn/Cd efflux system component
LGGKAAAAAAFQPTATASAAAAGVVNKGSLAHRGNIDAVYMTFYTDAVSSVSVIASSILVRYWGVLWVDAIQALAVSAFTLQLAVPMFKASGRILLQSTPLHLLQPLQRARREASVLDGVLDIGGEHFWTQAPGVLVGSVRVRVRPDASEQSVLDRVRRIYGRVVDDLTVEVERDADMPAAAQEGGGAAAGVAGAGAADSADSCSTDGLEGAHSHSHSHSHGACGHSHI